MPVPTSNTMNTTNQQNQYGPSYTPIEELDYNDDTVYFEKGEATISNDMRGLDIPFPDNNEGAQIFELADSTNPTSGRHQPPVRVNLQNMNQAVGHAIFNSVLNEKWTIENEPSLVADQLVSDDNTIYVTENIRETPINAIYFLDEYDNYPQVR